MIPVEKNKTYEIKIAALGSNGEGIGRIEGYTVFVEGALPSETCLVLIVKTRKHFGYGKLLEILTPSPDRREPCCPVAKQCGGCQLQHLSYAAQLAYKTKEVQDDLERLGATAIRHSSPWGRARTAVLSAFMPNAATALWIPSSASCKMNGTMPLLPLCAIF